MMIRIPCSGKRGKSVFVLVRSVFYPGFRTSRFHGQRGSQNMGILTLRKQESVPQMFKITVTVTVSFNVLCDVVHRFHRAIGKSADVDAIGTHPFHHDEGVNDRLEEVR